MIQITPQMHFVVAIEPADFRKGIDGLARLCQEALLRDPFIGWVFVFRNRKRARPVCEELIRQAAAGDVLHNDGTAVKILEWISELLPSCDPPGLCG